MYARDIRVGGRYTARVGANITTVRVDGIRESVGVNYGRYGMRSNSRTVYDVTNERTGRRVTFRSPQRFREVVT